MRVSLSLWLLSSVACSSSSINAFTITPPVATRGASLSTISNKASSNTARFVSTESSSESESESSPKMPPPPVLNGKMVLPVKVVQIGVESHKIAAVYALVTKDYKRGKGNGWKEVDYVGTTLDLAAVLDEEVNENDTITHVRALSFSFPQEDAMADVAEQWKTFVKEAGGELAPDAVVEAEDSTDNMLRQAQMNAMSAFSDEDDDDDDDDDDIDMMMPPPPTSAFTTDAMGVVTRVGGADEIEDDIISPFAKADNTADPTREALPFTAESVNLVLDEVRPYLIADGGNVSVDRVDADTKNVYLKLEGACGSCASSTVTMQMGIEKVLKENFADLGQVIQVDSDEEETPIELSLDMVMVEVNRIGPAIFAMGGQYDVVSVDGAMGVVEIKFKGPNKLQQGLELALLDIPLCKHVKFTMYE